ncbi:HAD family phosphatase [Thioclava litoralis]|uniref:HAD family phosphatase n=1 Tax=Thioclava litoralis TaxID=3076557 RepID=A0ABZ1E1U4_9RHOB|nr:HAD family phosphatase [Thioclava sp. FTW29]
MVKAVIFDCDGVLVDSEPMTFDLLQEEFTAHGLELTLHEMERIFIGGTIEGCAARAREMGASLPADWGDHYYAVLCERLRAGTPLMAGVPELLDRLDAEGISYAVGSNGRHVKMAATLGQHPEIRAKLEGRLFSGQEDVAHPKPAPDLYLHCAEALGVAPAECVVIEDSPAGARAAAAADMRCLGYAPQGDHPALAATGAELFTDMAQVPALLGLDG